MLTVERQQIILDLLKEHKAVKIQQLVEATDASESTIRRDLTELEKARLLKRIHGGAAQLQRKLEEPTVAEKTSKNNQEKAAIAEHAASLVEDGDCVFIDAGTTTIQMIPFLKGKDIVAVTNGISHINALLENEIKTYVTGGFVKGGTYAFVGRNAIRTLESFRFDKAFMGTNSVHEKFGYTTPDPDEAFVKQTAMELSIRSFVLIDHTKFGETSFARFADLQDAEIITSSALDPDQLKNYQKHTRIEVVQT